MTRLVHSRRARVLILLAATLLGTGAAWAYWVSSSSGTGSGHVGSLAAPSGVGASVAEGSGNVSLSWTASAPGGPAPAGYYAVRWSGATPTVVGAACGTHAAPIHAVACTDTGAANGTYTYTVVAVYRSWSASSGHSAAVTVARDTTPPTDSLSLGASPVHAFLSGSTLYFASGLGGSFTLRDTVVDSGSGPASATFPQLTASHWTHAAETVTSPAGGPFASSTYSWTPGAATPGAAERTVTSADVAGNTSTGSALTFTADSTAPAGGALTVNGAAASSSGTTSSSTTTAFTIGSRADYKETLGSTQAGLASSTLTVQSETLAKNVCGEPGSGGAYASPTVIAGTSNPAVVGGFCYRYTLTGTDNVGNAASVATTVKVDTVAPTNSLSLATASHAFLEGTTLYYGGAASGSFKLVDTVGDSDSGPASATFPALSQTKWTHSKDTVTTPAEGPYTSSTYSWSAGATAPTGSQVQFTSADAAGNTSAPTTLTFVSDTTAPSGGALTVNGTAASTGGSTSASSTAGFTIGSRTDYSESQSATKSGLESSALTIQSETFTNGTCGSPGSGGPYTTPTVIAGTANPAIASGFCYRYALTGTDEVGNEASVSTTVKVDTTAPGAPSVTLSSPTGNTFVNGTTVFIDPLSGKSGGFVATGSATDGESGIASIKLPSLSGFASGGGTLASPFKTTYEWSGTAAAGAVGAQSATATNGSGLTETANAAFTVVSDTTAPTGGSVSAPPRASGSVPVTFVAGSDAGSGISTSQDAILRAEATYNASTDACGSFGSFSSLGSPGSSPYSDATALASKCYEYEYRASDNVGNTVTYGPTSAVKPGPKALSITAVNGTGTKKKVDAKDVITFTFTESVDPATITSAWSAASQPEQTVTVTFKDSGEGNGTNKPDSFSVTTAGVHLGSVEMSGGNWVPTKGGAYSFTATMKFATSEGKSVVTVTLASLQSGGSTPGEQAEDTFTWSPDAAIADLAGNAIDTSSKATNKAEHF